MGNELHVISTGNQSVETFVHIIEKIHPYIHFVHIRERHWTAMEHLRAIELLVKKDIPLEKVIINDRVDVAHVAKVYGVQLAHHSLSIDTVKHCFPHLMISQSVHQLEQAMKAEAAGAHRLIYGHIYETKSKLGQKPRGLNSLKTISQHVNIPVIAIGGITPRRVQPIIKAGAKGVAVLSGILLADDPLKTVQTYAKVLHGGDSM